MKLVFTFPLFLLLSIFSLTRCSEDHNKKLESHDKSLSFFSNQLRVAGNQWESGDKIGIYAFSSGESFQSHSPKVCNLAYTTQRKNSTVSFTADLQGAALTMPESRQDAIDIYAYYPYNQQIQGGKVKLVRQGEESFPDLLFSENAKAISAETHAGSLVLLTFRHMMSRLHLQLINDAGEDLIGAKVSLTNIPCEGSFTFSTKTFSQEGSNKASTLFTQEPDLLYSVCLIPLNLTDENKIKIVYGGETYASTLPVDIRRLEAGKSYRLTLKLATPSSSIPSDENNYLGENITSADLSRLELPRPTGGSHNYLVTHKINGEVNYSVEFDTSLRTPRFVAFTFDRNNSPKNTDRKDAWSWDPLIPSRFEVGKNDFVGYSRGHLVASNDRVASVAANKQTFYYSNIALQNQSHNVGIWQKLEALVQDWARDKGMAKENNVLYVAKGITCDEAKGNDFVMGYGTTGIPVARFFWMAVVYFDGIHYYGIAFLTQQDKPKTQHPLRNYAMSIDELEDFLGQDLFFNFPDMLEEKFEAQKPAYYTHIWSGI